VNLSNGIRALQDEVTGWRRHIHAHPETAFEEHETARFIAAKLEEFGIEVHRGLGGTGVVGTLRRGRSSTAVGLRADMDALFIQEENTFSHRSRVHGKMHACGHDGHTAMLLGAASHLARHGEFDGTIQFIFQPAEETGDERCGGNAMVSGGLFEKFPVSGVFGLHNLPNIPLGQFSVRSGAMLASIDTFDFRIKSQQSHVALQYQVPDPMLVAMRAVEELHLFKARYVDPADPVVLSITQFQSGNPLHKPGVHVTPDEARVRGTLYTLNDTLRDTFEAAFNRIVKHAAECGGASYEAQFERGYPALINSDREKRLAVSVAEQIVGSSGVEADMKPVMGAEDFAFMLRRVPGCYVFLGTGPGDGSPVCSIHNPHYDFNDEIIPIGIEYWVTLAHRYLREATG
jgi:hippurate hydrolase